MLTYAVMPARSGGSPWRSVRRSRTGTRCTTLTQLPLAFCGGRIANSAPVAGEMLSTSASQVMFRVHVEHHGRLLPDAHIGEVGLLEIGFEPGPSVGDVGEQGNLRLHLLAELQLEIDHDAGARRLDLGMAEIERGTVAQRLFLAYRGIAVGRPVRVSAQRSFHARDALLQHGEAVARLLLVAVGLLDARHRGDAAARELALPFRLGLEIRYAVLDLLGLGAGFAQRDLKASTAARAASTSASALASARRYGSGSSRTSKSPAATAAWSRTRTSTMRPGTSLAIWAMSALTKAFSVVA